MYCLCGLLAWHLLAVIYANELPGVSHLESGFDAAIVTRLDDIPMIDQSTFRLFDLDAYGSQIYTLKTGNQVRNFAAPSVVQITDVSMLTMRAVESISKSFYEFVRRYIFFFSKLFRLSNNEFKSLSKIVF